ILTVLVANGAVLALIAIIQKMAEAKLILWFIKSPASTFHGTFVYKNHAGAYFNLVLMTAVGLTVWHYVRGLRRLERSSPSPVFAFGVLVLTACVLLSGSRTAMLLLAAYFVVGTVIYLILRRRNRGVGAGNPAFTGLVATCAVLLFIGAAYTLNLTSSLDQLKALGTPQGQHTAITMRVMARDATVDMFADKPIVGWGAGSFRHAFPMYQQNYGEIHRMSPDHRHFYTWHFAHNDYVQALAELGVIGFMFPVLALIWAIVKLVRLGALGQPGHVLVAVGLGATLAHAWVDFPLNNPAILGTFCALLVLLVRWAELETRP
ncbi:MAG: O-antigen ligase domain-containing protein, partial [Verrucomicrobia bacterium]